MSTPLTSLPADLMSPEQAAGILRLSKWTIYKWIERGYVPHYRMGRMIRIREADLLAKLESELRVGTEADKIAPSCEPGGLCHPSDSHPT